MIVTTPRPRRAAVALARSLLTITPGRRLFASLPCAGSRSIRRISPRSIGHPVCDGPLPEGLFAGCLPLLPCGGVSLVEVLLAKQPDRALHSRGSRPQPGG